MNYLNETQIVIPTYDRSAKLARTLECYHSFSSEFKPRIVILDGSHDEHAALNKKNAEKYENVTYRRAPNTSLITRMSDYLNQVEPDKIVALGTDEDVFLPDYIEASSRFLSSHPNYSMYCGRYVTFGRKLGPFRRVIQHRNTFVAFDVNAEDFTRRIALFSYAIALGCAPVYWGVRRAGQLTKSLDLRKQLHYQSTQEMVDQILLAYDGKIKFADTPMLLRDESKISYVYDSDRQDMFNYFPPEEMAVVERILRQAEGEKLVLAGQIFMDKYLLDYVEKGHPSLNQQSHLKTYSKFESIDSKESNRLKRIIFLLMKSVTVLSEAIVSSHEVRVLKKRYPSKVIDMFLRTVSSNETAG